MQVSVIGAGNMGAAIIGGLCTLEHKVHIADLNPRLREVFGRCECPYPEPGIADAMRLNPPTVGEKVLPESEYVFVCVQTPTDVDGCCDYSILNACLASVIADAPRAIIVISSTVFPGYFKQHVHSAYKPDDVRRIVYMPVFLATGSGLHDWLKPGKCVLGGDPESTLRMRWDINPSTPWDCERRVSFETAEWAKLLHNTFMALKISFVNELGSLFPNLRDAREAIETAFNESPQGKLLTTSHMIPGPPYSGTCLPKDMRTALRYWGDESIVSSVDASRQAHVDRVVQAMRGSTMRGKKVGICGLTFKPGYNEVRESIALELIELGCDPGQKVWVYDPELAAQDIELVARGDQTVLDVLKNRVVFVEELSQLNACEVVVLNRKVDATQLLGPHVIDFYEGMNASV